jgi:hypothetical protein
MTRFMKLHLQYLDEMRHVYFMRVSAQLGFVTGIKQQPEEYLGPLSAFWWFNDTHLSR